MTQYKLNFACSHPSVNEGFGTGADWLPSTAPLRSTCISGFGILARDYLTPRRKPELRTQQVLSTSTTFGLRSVDTGTQIPCSANCGVCGPENNRLPPKITRRTTSINIGDNNFTIQNDNKPCRHPSSIQHD